MAVAQRKSGLSSFIVFHSVDRWYVPRLLQSTLKVMGKQLGDKLLLICKEAAAVGILEGAIQVQVLLDASFFHVLANKTYD